MIAEEVDHFNFFNSQVHPEFRVKVTVMGCEYCDVIHGYEGAEPDSLAEALSGRIPGNYSLRVENFAAQGVMTPALARGGLGV